MSEGCHFEQGDQGSLTEKTRGVKGTKLVKRMSGGKAFQAERSKNGTDPEAGECCCM